MCTSTATTGRCRWGRGRRRKKHGRARTDTDRHGLRKWRAEGFFVLGVRGPWSSVLVRVRPCFFALRPELFVALPAPRLVVVAVSHLELLGASGGALAVMGGGSAADADGVHLVDVFGQGEEARHGAEGAAQIV